jgi:hypothetical protein
MKTIKSILIFTLTVVCLAIQSTAQAQSKPEFCKIHDGNLSRYVSQYDIFNLSTPTPYRPLIQNNRSYQIANSLAAKPLFYTGNSNGNIVTAFQLKGVMGKLSIGDKDIVTQLIRHNTMGNYAQVVGYCINGVFITEQKPEAFYLSQLPLKTQLALEEAKLGSLQEQVGNAFK